MTQSSTVAPLVYYARAVDGLDEAAVLREGLRIGAELAAAGLNVIDPVANHRKKVAALRGVTRRTATAEEIVCEDLRYLRKADALVVDMSIPHRNYVGCTAELVYARLWRIPSVVYVGSTDYDERIWLRAHSTVLVRDWCEAVQALARLLDALPGGATGWSNNR